MEVYKYEIKVNRPIGDFRQVDQLECREIRRRELGFVDFFFQII
jgi:hypothetical protein